MRFSNAALSADVDECVIGMSHRGRLSTLANIVGKSMVQFFSEFDGAVDPESFEGQGDVKYHLGATGVRRTSAGRVITVTVAFNPSHLEAVNPVAEGIARPKQDRLNDAARERVIPLLIHGDAAMAGQGVVPETMNLAAVKGYDHRRNGPLRGKQPDRIHHQPGRRPFVRILHRRLARFRLSRVSRERRRSGSLRPRHADGVTITASGSIRTP